ncbi:hypothetical protein BC835DRAFT_1372172 [Cytidiella melzeri]|nr:hypothetical protein BC835DRAFT_1372172 [Cytidiella melzeri]
MVATLVALEPPDAVAEKPARIKKSRKGKEVSKDNEPAEEGVTGNEEKREQKKHDYQRKEDGGTVKVLADKSTKRKELKGRVEDESQTATEDVGQRKKKRKRSASEDEGVLVTADTEPAHQSGEAEEAKKKRNRHKHEPQTVERSEEGHAKEQKKKKKRRQRAAHGLKDPSSDESLSEQATKALLYAYTQVDEPSSWKFNKARQNWLIRNAFSDEAIPTDYVPLVNRYLSGVQGGAREALIQTCRNLIAGQLEPLELSTVDSGETAPEEELRTSMKVSFQPIAKELRARDLLEVLTKDDAV